MNERDRDPIPALPANDGPTAPSPDAFDSSLLAMMRELTVEQRLEWLSATVRAIQELRDGLRT